MRTREIATRSGLTERRVRYLPEHLPGPWPEQRVGTGNRIRWEAEHLKKAQIVAALERMGIGLQYLRVNGWEAARQLTDIETDKRAKEARLNTTENPPD